VLLFTLVAFEAAFLYFPSVAGTAALGVFLVAVGFSIFSILRPQLVHYDAFPIDEKLPIWVSIGMK
jgi:hypothetical protein